MQAEEDAVAQANDTLAPNLLDWPAFIRSHFSDTTLRVYLHAVFQEDWSAVGTRGDLRSRLKFLSTELGLDHRQDPWILFLYIGGSIAQNSRSIKLISSWFGKRDITALDFLSALTQIVLKRHARDPAAPPMPVVDDIKALLEDLKHTPYKNPQREAALAAAGPISAAAAASASTSTSNPRKRTHAADETAVSGPSKRTDLSATPEMARVAAAEASARLSMGGDVSFSTLVWLPDMSSTFITNPSSEAALANINEAEAESESEDEVGPAPRDALWGERLDLLARLVEMGIDDLPAGESYAARQSRK